MSTENTPVRQIAKITSTMLGYEDHGILTAHLNLDYGDGAQGAGNYNLSPSNGSACARWVIGVMDVCGVDRWEKVVGRTVFAVLDGERGLVVALEPLPTETGKPFVFADAFKD